VRVCLYIQFGKILSRKAKTSGDLGRYSLDVGIERDYISNERCLPVIVVEVAN
jgi:hypothetical protein